MRRATRTLIVVAFLGGALPVGAFGPPATAAVPARFVQETLAPTPKADPHQVWLTNQNPFGPFQVCGTYPVTFRFEVPAQLSTGSTYLVNLRRNVRPWGGGFPPYTLVVRADGPGGPIAFQGPLPSGNAYLDLTASITAAHRGQGFVDLYPTILCGPPNEGWTWHPDSDWGYWDVEAYVLAPDPHTLPAFKNAVVYYRYGFPRLKDLGKHDLVILAATYPWFSSEYATLRKGNDVVAGYVSFTLDKRCSPSDPLKGDGQGPGGYDSRYVDFRSVGGAKVPDGFPDYDGESASCRWYVTDPRSASWQGVLLAQVADHVANGANGVFLDGFELAHPSLAPGLHAAVGAIRAAHPDLYVVINSYQAFFEVGNLVNGVMMESFTYAPGGVRIDPALDPIRDELARDANFVRGWPEEPRFSLLSLDAIEPYSASGKVDVAASRAAANGMTLGTWDMVLVNPAWGLKAVPIARGFKVTWKVSADDPDPEVMSSVGSYELRRLNRPFRTGADWRAATVVATGLPRGTRQVIDRGAPASGKVYYALRAYRTGASKRLLIATLKFRAR
ncbi:MAG: hypothetical protein HY658_06230 [Actinobacteria bacterium]|nr:hypothetical protein [Actinomycetota bacterium]